MITHLDILWGQEISEEIFASGSMDYVVMYSRLGSDIEHVWYIYLFHTSKLDWTSDITFGNKLPMCYKGLNVGSLHSENIFKVTLISKVMKIEHIILVCRDHK